MTSKRADKPKFPTFAEVKRAALQAIDRVLEHWLPGGKRVDGYKEYTAPNPTRADKHAGSLKVNIAKGTWCDFATGDKGGDLIDLVRYIEGCTDVEACNKLAEFLNVTAGVQQAVTPASRPALEWVAIVPVPEAAMVKVPKKHRNHGTPSKVWIYRDANSAPMMVLYRFDLGTDADGKARKVFATLTWCRRSSDQSFQWRWQGLAEPRPLLRLDELAQRPAAPVVLCEGEKAADAAAELLPHYVATCWPNGAQSYHKADFAPLAGRTVLLWPDNDTGGLGCMRALADQLGQLGATVRTVAIEIFAHGDGDGDDAADALAAGWTAERVAELESSGRLFAKAEAGAPVSNAVGTATTAAAPMQPERPAAAKKDARKPKQAGRTGGFKVKADGVYFAGDDGESRIVCSRLEILARTRDEKGHSWGLLVEFDDPDGAPKRWNIPARCMAGEFSKEVLGPLVDMGLRLAPTRDVRHSRNDLQSFLQSYDSGERARLVSRLGWHGAAFLLPDQQIGSSDERLHFYEAGAQLPPISQAGTLGEWQQHIGALCVGNHRVAFAVCIALAGPLLHLLGLESGGFHFYGVSSSGKSTTGRVACSVYGPPAFERSWRSTDNALESIAAAHSDGLLVLDEISQCDPRIVGETVYMLGNGIGKARANDRGQTGRQVQEWRLLFLSSGEYTLAQHMAEANKELKAGMEIRMLAIPADAGKGLGVFDTLHDFDSGQALADELKARVGEYYGTPLLAFLMALCNPAKQRGYVSIIRRSLEQFARDALPASASGQAHRAATRFGLAAVAGELATSFGITGWPDGTATAAARACLDAWLAERGGAGNHEGDAIVARLRLVVERFGESRFTRWESIAAKVDDHAPRTADRLGFRRTVEHGLGDALYTSVTYYFLSTAWRDEVFKGMNLRNVNRELVERGILLPGSDGKTAQAVTLPGMPKGRAYVVSASALLADESDSQDEAIAA